MPEEKREEKGPDMSSGFAQSHTSRDEVAAQQKAKEAELEGRAKAAAADAEEEKVAE